MTWIKLEDSFFTNKKIIDLTYEAKLLYLEAMCYASQHLTDGQIPLQVIPHLHVRGHQRASRLLRERGLWDLTLEGEYQIVNYLEYQTSKTQVEKVKQNTKNRVEAHRQRKAGNADVTALQKVGNANVTASEPEPQTEPEPDKKIKVIENDQPFDDSDFKVFWAAYPKKVKKQNALKSYIKAVKSATAQEIFEGLIRYQRVCGEDLKFVANPDSWLNQMRWTDVYEVPTISTRQNQTSNHFQSVETLQPPRITENEFFKPELTPEQLASRQKIIDQAKANTRGSRSA